MMLDYAEEKKLQNEKGGKTEEHRIATVADVSGTKMQLRFDGEETPSGKYYRGIAVCAAGKRVLCARVSGTYVVLGELL